MHETSSEANDMRTEFWSHHYSGFHERKKPKQLLRNLLFRNYWPDCYETLLATLMWYGEQTIQIAILISPLVWLSNTEKTFDFIILRPWQQKEKEYKLEKISSLPKLQTRFLWTSSEASVWYEKQTIQNGILISWSFWLSWQLKEKNI